MEQHKGREQAEGKSIEDLLACWHKVKKDGDMSKDEKFKAWEEIA